VQDHLRAVADRAAQSAGTFGSADWGRLAGLWHDLGKFAPDFELRLQGGDEAVDRSVVRAALAVKRFRDHGWLPAFPIAGHHAGLADLRGEGPPTPLAIRVAAHQQQNAGAEDISERLRNQERPALPDFLRTNGSGHADRAAMVRRLEFWIRYLFSAPVDAHWLDTETFFDPYRTAARARFESLTALHDRLSETLDSKRLALLHSKRASPINLARAEVLAACKAPAAAAPGFFSLTAPTGAGKTLSSMEFALRHAECNGLDRVIVVLPYTSIIEQNAAVYREAVGGDAVIEHHSSSDPREQPGTAGGETTYRHLRATENWDAPVIVTTTAQFFESLFSNRPSKCRKLHNIARIVIVLDEVQTLPTGFRFQSALTNGFSTKGFWKRWPLAFSRYSRAIFCLRFPVRPAGRCLTHSRRAKSESTRKEMR
jgi:CRISPR-associated endonuclease/helicase Cas3